MRILMLTQWFEPEPTFKGLLFAKELKKRGHEVTVLTGFPNYPTGKIYPGYKLSVYKKEVMDGINVIRVFLYPSHDRNPIKRILNYISFALSAAFIGVFLVPRCDVAYVYHPPATIGFAAWFLKVFRKIPFVYDIQDMWPDTVMQSGMMNIPLANKVLGQYCKWVYKKASHIIVLSNGFKRILESRGVKSKDITVVPNWCDEENIKPLPYNRDLAQEYGLFGKFNIIFAGNMGSAQGLNTVIEAAKMLSGYNDIQFVFIGEGTELPGLEHLVKEYGLANVKFIPRQPMHQIGKFLSLADVLLVHLIDNPLFKITIPSKTQAYMRMGKPVLMGVRGDAAEIVDKNSCGLSFEPENAKSLAEAILRIKGINGNEFKMMGDNGIAAYEREMSMDKGVSQISSKLSDSSVNVCS